MRSKAGPKALALGCALFLGACNGPEVYMQFGQLAKQSFSNILGNRRITREEAASIPFASLGYRIGRTNEQMLVLSSQTNVDQLWTSATRVVFLTRQGRLVRTVGLAHDLSAFDASRSKSVPAPAEALRGPFNSVRIVDYPDLSAYGSPISCSARLLGRRGVTILGSKMNLARVDEVCRSANLDWSFTDSYWIEPETGFVWRSIQHTHPKMDAIEMEVLRRPT
jgi:hypothetical protein